MLRSVIVDHMPVADILFVWHNVHPLRPLNFSLAAPSLLVNFKTAFSICVANYSQTTGSDYPQYIGTICRCQVGGYGPSFHEVPQSCDILVLGTDITMDLFTCFNDVVGQPVILLVGK